MRLDEELVGDPLEKAMMNWIDWSVTKRFEKYNIQNTFLIFRRRYHAQSLFEEIT